MTDIDRNMTNISLARSFDFTSLTGLGVFLRNNDLDVQGSSFKQVIADSNRTEAVYEPYVSLPMLEKSLPSAAHEQHLPLAHASSRLPNQSVGYNCPGCGLREPCETFETFVAHLQSHLPPSFGASCPFGECLRYFSHPSSLLRHIIGTGHSITDPVDECQYNISQPLLDEYFHQRLPAFTPSLSILLPQKILRCNNDRYTAFCSHCMLIVNLYKVGNGARDWSREEDMVLLENGSNLAELRVDVTLEKRSATEIEKRLERLNEFGEHFRQSALQRAFAVWLMHGVECHNNPQATVRGTPPDELSLMMERYLSSSSEDEAAAIEDIVEESIHYTNPVPQGDFENWRDPDEVVSSVDSTSSATFSATSLSSHCSHGSLESRRKHNLRLHKRRVTANPSCKQTQAQYQCTFCMADFSNSGNWSRHEHNIHLVAKHWVCAPDGIKESTNCLYCDGSPLSTLSDHTCTETCLRTAVACSRKPIEARTFSCKEHLKQHLKHSHGVSVWSQKFESWSKTVALLPQQARCGFCGEKFGNWNSRMKHIAREFRNGAQMDSNWSGMWGLDQEWDLRVRQNGAISPHDRKNYPKKARQLRRR